MIYVTGDVHGDYDGLMDRQISKLKKGDQLIITGDFGFVWDNSKNELNNLKKLSKKKYEILFVEGAHENFEKLREYPEVDLYQGKGYRIASNIYCLKRGEIYMIGGKSVFTLGGGLPPYEDEPRESPPSMPTDDEMQYAVENIQHHHRHVDLIVTHEAPASVKRMIDRSATVNDLNMFLDTVMKNTRYDKWFFGALHQDRAVSDKLICVFEDVHKVE